MKEMWVKRGLPGEVIDITPNEVDVVEAGNARFYDLVDRGLEIDQWIIDNKFDGKYLILDDTVDFSKHQLPYFIKTSTISGLSFDDAREIVLIL